MRFLMVLVLGGWMTAAEIISFEKEEKIPRLRLKGRNIRNSVRSKRHYEPSPLLNVGRATAVHPPIDDRRTYDENSIDSHRYDDDHNDIHSSSLNGEEQYVPENFIVDDTGAESGPWGPWNYPSQCSRPCGGGVSIQERICRTEGGCSGASKRFFSCNIQECPVKVDFRAEQCSAFDTAPFEGRYYTWIPYMKAPNKCELNCMPKGERFYYRHKRRVTDGTKCNEEGNDLCVDGKCLPVGCDGLLGSTAKEDKCRFCGGDGSNCKTIAGINSENDFKVGYNDILLIPAGATNIIVKERTASNNYLAIRNVTDHYYLNGNWRIDFPREVTFANTIFHYERKPHSFFAPESIRAIGPISEAIYIVVLYQETNPGIEYEYSVRSDGVITDTSDNTYSWVFTDWTTCSAECGGGVQERDVSCGLWRGDNYDYVENYLCDITNKPNTVQTCNERIPCPIRWYVGGWESCSAPRCTNETGTQMRLVFCEQIVGGASSRVEDSLCEGDMPHRSQECSYQSEICPTWFVGQFSPCSHLCGEGKLRRQVTCYSKDANGIHILGDEYCVGEKPNAEEDCYERPCDGLDWITSPWIGCEEGCGVSLESRKVQCSNAKGTLYDEKFCTGTKPDVVQDCKIVKPCIYNWYAVQWQECTGECGENGERRRKVFCGALENDNVKVVEDSLCDPTKKYHDSEECSKDCPQEVKAEWFAGPWQECSKACGGGQRFRSVVCLFGNKTDVSKCSQDDILYPSEDCNTNTCGKDELVVSPTVAMIEEDDCDEEELELEVSGSGSGAEESMMSTDGEMFTSGFMSGNDDGATLQFSSSSSSVSLVSSSGDGPLFSSSLSASSSGDGMQTTDSLVTDDSTLSSTGSGDGDVTGTEGASEWTTSVPLSDVGDASDASEGVSDSSSQMTMTETTEGLTSPDSVSMTSSESSTEQVTTSEQVSSTQDAMTSSETDSSTMATTPEESTETTLSSSWTTTATEQEQSTEETTTDSETATETSTKDVATEVVSTEGTMTMTTEVQIEYDNVDKPKEVGTKEDDYGLMDFDFSKLEACNETENVTCPPTAPTDAGSSTAAVDVDEDDDEQDTSSVVSGSGDLGSGSGESGSGDVTVGSGLEVTTSSSSDWDVSTGSSPSISFTQASTSMTSTELAEMEEKQCRKKKKVDCSKATFGCCPNKIDVAKGPFAKGCKLAKTCAETEFKCCKDDVTPALGTNFKGCPKIDCNMTLFGCCPDKITPKTDNTEEGCLKHCNETRFGCCSDELTPATGPNYKGCNEIIINGKPCGKTTHGCCPDKNNHATGPNFKGCKEIDLKNCTKNYFGCCDDGVTSVLSEDKSNCPAKCESDVYGCCDDGKTSSHGPNKEGCCLMTEFGCCPDNIVPADDLTQSNCNCTFTPFKCCPDNKTAARGENNYGCGCKFTEFGCCPDLYSEAKGRDNEGCSCDTFQYGCCPDGVTVDKGNNKEGCGCEYTEKGCCGDRKTPKDADGECGCESSQFGCCPDGNTNALGEDFEGCQDIPIKPGDVCGLDKDRGSCRNFTVKWFFDMEYGGCSRFWYGGCDGNENRFKSQDECKAVCVQPEGTDACYLPQVAGPCEGYYPTWYYDPLREMCHQFIYGGCLGNNNRFPSRELCENTCLVSDRIDACDQVKTEGPCKGNYTRWFFDKDSDSCKQFVYGGCKKNLNNFLSEKECTQKCKSEGRIRAMTAKIAQLKKCSERTTHVSGCNETFYYDLNLQNCVKGCGQFWSKDDCFKECAHHSEGVVMGDACYLKKAEGGCGEKLARWYYDINEQRCVPFYYTGCQGNNNRFTSIEECEKICPAALIGENTCQEPASMGDCTSYTERFFYDVYEGRCKAFVYSGCGGNSNNYYSIDECRNKCESIDVPPPRIATAFHIGQCFSEPDEGSECEGQTSVRWYYDSRDGVCRQFRYTGCGGNHNSFDNSDECEENCQKSQDICQLEQVSGPCHGNFQQFFYDSETDTCQQFTYGGCQGNGNRFDSMTQCEQRCKKEISEINNYIVEEVEEPRQPERNEPDEREREEPIETTTVIYADSNDLCQQRAEVGPCSESIDSWYYDVRSSRCQLFTYGGCQGNDNRFESEEQCERNCGEFRGVDVCNLPADIGPCRGRVPKYFFDNSEKACRVFTYGGCQGNGNRFSTLEECESVCFERNEVLPDYVNRTISGAAICKQKVDVGPCGDGYKRWFYDAAQRTCIPFVYGGCSGNLNRFKNFDICISFCSQAQGLQGDHSHFNGDGESGRCLAEEAYCSELRCPYGTERWEDEETSCVACQCRDVCRDTNCQQNQKCAVDIFYEPNSNGDTPSFRPICREMNKTGICPVMTGHTKNCVEECSTDADCSDQLKCCFSTCGSNCIPPISSQNTVRIISEESEILAEEGGLVSLECVARGSPSPKIIWTKNGEKIVGESGRMRILEDNTLQIVGVYKEDEGTFTCTASNSHSSIEKHFSLHVQQDPAPSQATILEHATPELLARLNEPTNIRCFAIGWPRPSITWWRGETMLPSSSEKYEQLRDYSLRIRLLTLRELGGYTCQAYNGLGRAASYTVYVFGQGDVDHSAIGQSDNELLQYVIPTHRTSTNVVLPPAPYVPDPLIGALPSPHLTTPPTPATQKYTVSLRAEIFAEKRKYNQGDEIRMDCKYEGYPPPDVSWLHEGAKLYSNDRIWFTEDNSLVISNGTVSDSGVYTCTVSNEYNSVSDTVDISVEALHLHANCTDNPFFANCKLIVKASYCTNKYYARFCCKSCTLAGQLPSYGPHLQEYGQAYFKRPATEYVHRRISASSSPQHQRQHQQS